MNRTPQDQLAHFLSDMYSVERQALAQLARAPEIADDDAIAGDFQLHHAETELHAALIEGRLEAHGGSVSSFKDALMMLGGKGFLLFARLQPETPGRLVAHAYSYEAMEWAGYEMLIRFAEDVGDSLTADIARRIRDEERQMMERLESRFDAAEQASHADLEPEQSLGDLCKHLGEAHALESQGSHFLGKASEIAGNPLLAQVCHENFERSRAHADLLKEHLEALGSSVSVLKDAALSMGGLNWGFFFQAQSDTPAKLAAFAYAYEHLKIAAYELLLRTALRAGNTRTASLCETLLADEHAMTVSIRESFDSAATATLAAVEA